MYLCTALQEILGLPEPPHFLVPGYTATIDRWLDPRTQQLQTSAELYPLVRHHQTLLNTVFDMGNLVWQVAPDREGLCDPMVLETYRPQFPQLWEEHDLIVRFERTQNLSYPFKESYLNLQRQEVSFATVQSESFANKDFISISETTASGSAMLTEQDEGASEELLPELNSTASSSVSITPNANAPLPLTSTVQSVSDAESGLYGSQQEGSAANLPSRESDNRGSADSFKPTNTTRSPQSTPASLHSNTQDIKSDSQPQHAQGYVLRLFVSGHSAATEYTLMSLHQLLEHSLRLPYTLKVIDVFKHPDQAEVNQISATPTLLRVWPQPVRRIVGDLTDAERILRILAMPES